MPLTFSHPNKKTKLQLPTLSKVGQGSDTAHGYETDIDSLGQATNTRARTYTHTFVPLLLFSHSADTGQASANTSARGRKGRGQRGQSLCVCVCTCLCDGTNWLLKAALPHSYAEPSGCVDSPPSSQENSSAQALKEFVFPPLTDLHLCT